MPFAARRKNLCVANALIKHCSSLSSQCWFIAVSKCKISAGSNQSELILGSAIITDEVLASCYVYVLCLNIITLVAVVVLAVVNYGFELILQHCNRVGFDRLSNRFCFE